MTRSSISRSKLAAFCCVIVLIWSILASLTQLPAEIDPRVLEDTEDGKTAQFLVLFEQQIDLQVLAPLNNGNYFKGKQMVDGLMILASETQESVRTYLESAGVRYVPFWIANVIAVRGDRSVVEALARYPEVVLIEPDRAFTVNLVEENTGNVFPDVSYAPNAVEPNLMQVHAPEVWARGAIGSGTVYAVADTGVYWQHEALISKYRGWNGTSA